MTIGKFGDPNPEPYFQLLSECRAKVADALSVDRESLELSMGMSGDYEKVRTAQFQGFWMFPSRIGQLKITSFELCMCTPGDKEKVCTCHLFLHTSCTTLLLLG